MHRKIGAPTIWSSTLPQRQGAEVRSFVISDRLRFTLEPEWGLPPLSRDSRVKGRGVADREEIVESPYSLTGLLEQPELPQPVPAQAMRQAMQEAAPLATLPPLPNIPDADLLTPGSAEYDRYLP